MGFIRDTLKSFLDFSTHQTMYKILDCMELFIIGPGLIISRF